MNKRALEVLEDQFINERAVCRKRKGKDSKEDLKNNAKKLNLSKNKVLEKDIDIIPNKALPNSFDGSICVAPQKLPVKKVQPVRQTVSGSCTANLVFFDVETTSLRLFCDITQIAAVDKNEVFNEYVTPSQKMNPTASILTGITCDNGILKVHGRPVEAKSRVVALEKFLKWLELRSPALLFAHKAQFDYTRLFRAIYEENLVKQFEKHIIGFVDTVQMFKSKYPGLVNYKQKTLVGKFLKKSYEQHNAVEDAKLLKELYHTTQPHNIADSSCTFMSSYNKWFNDLQCMIKKETFIKMINMKCVSDGMATKMARLGLTLADVKSAYEKDSHDGVAALLSQEDENGKPRVTKHKGVINNIIKYLHKAQV
nr:uncharacterized protein LOC123760369 [Procambarus clarkii]